MKAAPIEIAWSVIAGIGMLITGWMILDSWLDYRAVRRGIRGGYARARGARWWIALGALVGNGMYLFVWAGFVGIGLIAMQYPPPPRLPDQEVSTMWSGWMLIAMEGLLALAQVWARFVRGRVVGNPHTPTQAARP